MSLDLPKEIRERVLRDARAIAVAAPSSPPAYRPLEAVSGSQFVADYIPLEQLWDGIIPMNRLISLTAPTGAGKTAILTTIELHLVAGRPLAGRDLAPGRVLCLCGENPDDKRMRMIATAQQMGIEMSCLDLITVVSHTFSIEERLDEISSLAMKAGGFSLVSVDTSPAFHIDGDENDNVQMRRHASIQRALTELPGRPAVVTLCHPTKSATRDNLLPRGGGAFLAEVDGNLTAWRGESGIVTLHWAGKFRGPSFDPIRFELPTWVLDGYADRKGRPVHSVVAVPVSDDRAEQLHAKELDDQDCLLHEMQQRPGSSVRQLAAACGWISGTGKPQASRANRRLQELKAAGIAEQDRRRHWRLTSKGQKEADRLS